jgi:hypothetical protein
MDFFTGNVNLQAINNSFITLVPRSTLQKFK